MLTGASAASPIADSVSATTADTTVKRNVPFAPQGCTGKSLQVPFHRTPYRDQVAIPVDERQR